MELKFKKEELDFLSLYSICSDKKTRESDKFQILSVDGSSDIIFLQYSKLTIFITIFKDKNVSKEKIVLTYESSKFSDVLKYCPNGADITITDNFVSFGRSSKYAFESFDLNPFFSSTSFDNMLHIINNKAKYKAIEVLDFEKINLIRTYAGADLQGLNVIALYENHFVISDKIDSTGIVKTKNKLDSNYFLSLITYNVFQFLKLKSLVLYDIKDQGIFLLEHNNVNILFIKNPEQVKLEEKREDELTIPNVLDPKIKSYYYHDLFIKLNKEYLLNSLRKINIVTDSKSENRIFITFSSDKISIETRDSNQCLEEINYPCPKELFDVTIALSSNFTISMVSSIPGEEVIIRLPHEEDNFNAISLMDVDESVVFVQPIHSDSCIS